jgi:hypothetical protein
MTASVLEVKLDELTTVRVTEEPAPEPGPGQALLGVDAFGLSANNVTYAFAGRASGYWGFFPASAGWGRVPVWGFGEVLAARDPRLKEGRRVYGYLPMSTHLLVDVGEADNDGFTDASAHRAELPAVYNRYRFTDSDPMYNADREPQQALLWPLFYTSFLIDDLLRERGFFGASTILISSASSKTAIGTAFLLSGCPVQVVGLTSARNLEFVTGLNCYQAAIAYDEVETTVGEPTVYLDIAGDTCLLRAVHQAHGEGLRESILIGVSHWKQRRPRDHTIPGPDQWLFRAPEQIQRRTEDAVAQAYRRVAGGEVSPSVGPILSMWPR